MIMSKIVWFIVLSISTVILGISNFACDTARPLRGSDTTCKCVTTNNIEWQLDDVTLSACNTAGFCSPLPPGYLFPTDTSNADKEYNLTVQGFEYSSCSVYSCTDVTSTEEQKISLEIAAFDSTSPSVFVEPGINQNGNIEITTECLFKESDIMVEWYYVKKNSVMEVPYTPGARFQTSTNCADTCNGEAAVRLNIGFTHTKDGTQEVKFGLRVYHKENTTNVLDIQTSSEYYIKATTDVKDVCPGLGNSTAVDSKAKCGCAWFGICCALILFLIALGFVLEWCLEIRDDLNIGMKIVLCFLVVGFGFWLCSSLRHHHPHKHGGNENLAGDVPLNKNQSNVMNTKFSN